MCPSSNEYVGRSPEGPAMHAPLRHLRIAMTGRLRSGPALGPRFAMGNHYG
jgi:hypothetical protein